MKQVKALVVAFFFLIECFFFAVMVDMALEDAALGIYSFGVAGLLAFAGAAVVSLVEIARIIKGKTKRILPMFGMKATVFVFAISVGMMIEFFTTGDRDALWAGITFAILTLVMVASGYGIKQGYELKKIRGTYDRRPKTRFYAKWHYHEALAEYCQLNGLEVPAQKPFQALNDRIYIYACNYFSYLFLWLVRRNGLSELLYDDLYEAGVHVETENLKIDKGNPAEFLYVNMNGKIYENDTAGQYRVFLDSYFDSHDADMNPESVCYRNDYNELVRDAQDGVFYCRDFSWELYRNFEERLNSRYEAFLQENKPEGSASENRDEEGEDV